MTAGTVGAIILGGAHGSLAVARSLGRQGIPVVYFSAQPTSARFSRYVTHNVSWNGSSDPQAMALLLKAAERLTLDGWVILPSGDGEVQFVTQNFAALSQRFKLVTMPWAQLEQLNNKALLYRLADTLGISYPLVHADGMGTNSDANAIQFPVVIKPSSTEKANPLTKAKAWRAENAAEYRQKFALATQYMGPDGFVVQQLIPGDGSTQYSYAGLWAHGREICGLTARRARQYPSEFGTSPFVETVEAPDVAKEARSLLAATRYHGLVEVEFKLDQRDNRLKLLDVNTRIWAWIGLGAAAGLDFPVLAVALALGGEPVLAGEAIYGPTWLNAIPNTLSLLQSLLRRGNLGYAGAKSVLHRSVTAIFAGDDIKPALVEVPVQVFRRVRHLLRG